MRIAFDAKRYFNNRTGLGNYSREIVHALAKNFPRHEFILFHNEPKEPLEKYDNLKTISPANAGKLWRTFFMSKDLQRHGVDIYHGLSNEIPTGLAKHKIKSVVTIHDAIFMRYPGYYNWLDRNIYRIKTKNAIKNADRILATSEATAADLKTYFQCDLDKTSVVYQPVNERYYSQENVPSSLKGDYFIYVSSFTGRKNHGTLIQAFARIAKMTDWNLVLAGSNGETLGTVENFIRHEKLEDRISIFKDVNEDTLISLMQHASAFVYPSLFEGFGIPLAEAAVCGLPIAASNIPVFKELAGDAALYFHQNKFEEIADAMLKLTNPDLQRQLKQQLPYLLQKINAKTIAEKIMGIYETLS